MNTCHCCGLISKGEGRNKQRELLRPVTLRPVSRSPSSRLDALHLAEILG